VGHYTAERRCEVADGGTPGVQGLHWNINFGSVLARTAGARNMGHRLSKIYTRTGDDGTTGLGDGSRTDKDSLRVTAYGTTDELNSVIGMVLATLDSLNEALPPLKDFILPGGSAAAAACHLGRTVCRRAERCVISLGRTEDIPPCSVQYLNRLSDLLFVIARVLARSDGGSEVLWQQNREPVQL